MEDRNLKLGSQAPNQSSSGQNLKYVKSYLSINPPATPAYISASLGIEDVSDILENNPNIFGNNQVPGGVKYYLRDNLKQNEFELPQQYSFDDYEYSSDPLEPLSDN